MKNFSFKIAFIGTYEFLMNNILMFLKTSFIVILLYSFVEYTMKSHIANLDEIASNGYNILIIIFSGILQLILSTMFVVAWGGYYLRKIPTVQIIDVLNWNEIKTNYIIANLKLFGIVILLSMISYLIISLANTLNIDMLSYLVIGLVVFAQLIVLTRVMFILPHVIDGFSGNISNAIDITKGNSIKLLFSYIGVILPVSIISLLFVLVTDYNSYSYFEALIMTVFVFISQAIITVYYINVYKQLTQ